MFCSCNEETQDHGVQQNSESRVGETNAPWQKRVDLPVKGTNGPGAFDKTGLVCADDQDFVFNFEEQCELYSVEQSLNDYLIKQKYFV